MQRRETRQTQREAVREVLGTVDSRSDGSPGLLRYLRSEAALAGHHRTPSQAPGPDPAPTLTVPERHQVVVGFDDSADSYLALDQAAREAAWRGWPLRVVHVQDPAWWAGSRERTRTEGAELLEDAADRACAEQPAVAVSTSLRVGSAAGELIEASRDAGLVVVGTRGLDGFAELVTGSVAAHVAAEATAPVLVVRVPSKSAQPEWAQRPLLVGVDGSPAGYAAFEFAVAEARLRGVGILVVHAATSPRTSADPLYGGTLAGFDTHCLGVHVQRRFVDQDPRRALVRLSARASAVVVGARGGGGFPGLRAGSVAQALIHRAHSPVFVVHDPDAHA